MRAALILAIAALASRLPAQTPPDSLSRVVDSLFTRASSGELKYRHLVQPAKEALGEMGEAAVPRLLQKMDTQDAREMHTLVDIFKLIGHPAVPYLVDAVGSEEPFARRLALRVLGEMKDSSAVEGILCYADDPDFRIRGGVVTALGKIGDKRGMGPSMAALADRDYLVRTAAAIALSAFADFTTVPALISALSDPYYGVRYKAAEALWKIGKPAVEPVKKALLAPADTLALYHLLEVAGNLRDKRLVRPVAVFLDSKDPIARAFAAEALGKIGTKKAKKLLSKRRKTETHPFVISKMAAAGIDRK